MVGKDPEHSKKKSHKKSQASNPGASGNNLGNDSDRRAEDIQRLDERLIRLENEARNVRLELEGLKSALPGPGARQASAAPPHSLHSPHTHPPRKTRPPGFFQRLRETTKDSRELELLVGGNFLGKLGLLALVLASGWFVKYAFDQRWLNESGRIFLGLLGGAALIAVGLYLARRLYRALPGPVIGAGASILYSAWFSAFYFYGLLGREETFIGLVVLSLWLALLAWKADSEFIYLFSLAGVFLTPILLTQGENSYRFLFTYLTGFNLLFLFISRERPWVFAPFSILFLNVLVYANWADSNLSKSAPLFPACYLMTLYLIFWVRESIFIPGQTGRVSWRSLALLFLNQFFFTGALFALVETFYPSLTPFYLLFMAGVQLGIYTLSERVGGAREPIGTQEKNLRGLLLGSFLFLVFMALSDMYSGSWRTFAWLALAGSLALVGARYSLRFILFASIPFWLAGLSSLIFVEYELFDFRLIFNRRFFLYLFAATLSAGTYLLGRKYWKAPLFRGENLKYMRVFGYLGVFLLVLGTMLENHDYFWNRNYRNLGYTYILGFYALALLIPGLIRRSPSLRYSGIFLLCLLVLKLYGYDIWTMSQLVRIIAGLSLGVTLLVISVFYQRWRDIIFDREN